MKIALIDTIPSDARGKNSVNMGYEIVKDYLNAKPYDYRDQIHDEKILAFNIFYPTHVLNVIPFLVRNGIEPSRGKRTRHRVVVGGQGIPLNHDFLNQIADDVFVGEIEGEEQGKNGRYYAKEILSKPVIKSGNGVIELTRGCKYKCKFCEYSWVTGGPYREKHIDLVKEQIDYLWNKRIWKINFMSANFAGYSRLEELHEYCLKKGVYIRNSDMAHHDLEKFLKLPNNKQKTLKIGVESFNEITRYFIGKGIDDDKLKDVLFRMMRNYSSLHLYLIFGLPTENYDSWFKWLEVLGNERKRYTHNVSTLFGSEKQNTKNIRIEMNLTNFEPCEGTPLGDYQEVDFKEKDSFLRQWIKHLHLNGFLATDNREYKTLRGRMGRKENSYRLLMALKKKNPDLMKLNEIFRTGVSRSIDDDKAERALQIL